MLKVPLQIQSNSEEHLSRGARDFQMPTVPSLICGVTIISGFLDGPKCFRFGGLKAGSFNADLVWIRVVVRAIKMKVVTHNRPVPD